MANFINPETTMHHPAGYTHVVEVTADRPVFIAGQIALLTGVVAPGGHTRYCGLAEVHVCFATRRSSLSLAAGAATVPA